jgi:hypothetical protein
MPKSSMSKSQPRKKAVRKSAKKTGGMPSFVPTEVQREAVVAAMGGGATHAMLANMMGISTDTLTKHFRNELDHGSEMALNQIATTLYQKAKAGDVACMIFYLKARGRGQWSEKQQVDVKMDVGPDWTALVRKDAA